MKLISVNAGLPRAVTWHGRTMTTGIFKAPVLTPVRVGLFHLDGDGQADLTVHGGRAKAVYAYPSEHYTTWRQEAGAPAWPWGTFGENLTTEGLLEDEVRIGDRFLIGTAELVVTQPRMPCFKLASKLRRPVIIRRFLTTGRTGWYFAVAREGTLQAGDEIVRVARGDEGPSIAELARGTAGEGARIRKDRVRSRS